MSGKREGARTICERITDVTRNSTQTQSARMRRMITDNQRKICENSSYSLQSVCYFDAFT
jgi:hypothetical protein